MALSTSSVKDAKLNSLAEQMGQIAKARCHISFNAYTDEYRIKFVRGGHDITATFEPYEVYRENDDKLTSAMLQFAEQANYRLSAKESRPERLSYDGRKAEIELMKGRKHRLSDGVVIYLPENDDMDGMTSSERFDSIEATIQAVNLEMLRQVGRPHTCQVWATVKDMGGAEHQIVSDEDFTAEKFIYSDRGGINDVVIVMKPAPDANGKVVGVEVLLSISELEDCFPEVYREVQDAVKEKGYASLAQFGQFVKNLVAGRSAFGRALSEMSHSTLTVAREEAAKAFQNEREGFYGNQKDFGLF